MTPFASLLNTLLPALAVVASVEVLFRVWRGFNAATRFAVWWIALAAVMLLPFVYSPERHTARGVFPAPAAAATEASAGAPAIAAEPARPMDLRPIVIPAAGSVAAAMLAQLVWGYVWLRRAKRRSAVSAKSQRFEYLKLRYGVSRQVRLLESSDVPSPIAAGFLKPAVILPVGLAAKLSIEELDHVLLHELAHIARRDDWTNLLAQVLRAALWFHPAVRWVIHRMEQEREMACDDWAAGAAGERRRYAASLTRLIELRIESRPLLLATGALGGKPRITRRVESLLTNAGAIASGISIPKVLASFGAVALLAAICSEGPELVAAVEEPVTIEQPAEDQPPEQVEAKSGYLAGMASAGYGGLTVDELIELKNNGITPEYASAMSAAGLGKASPHQLIELRNHGIKPEFVRGLASAGLRELTLRNLIALASHGVRPEDVTEIHALGFGPFSAEQFIGFAKCGANRDYFRQLKEHDITSLDPKDIPEAMSQGVTGRDIKEARRYHPGIDMRQIVKLKQAGVI